MWSGGGRQRVELGGGHAARMEGIDGTEAFRKVAGAIRRSERFARSCLMGVCRDLCFGSQRIVLGEFAKGGGLESPGAIPVAVAIGRFTFSRRPPKFDGPTQSPSSRVCQAHEFGGARGGERSMAEAEGNGARGDPLAIP